MSAPLVLESCFFFNDTATTEIYTLSLHDALPLSYEWRLVKLRRRGAAVADIHAHLTTRFGEELVSFWATLACARLVPVRPQRYLVAGQAQEQFRAVRAI